MSNSHKSLENNEGFDICSGHQAAISRGKALPRWRIRLSTSLFNGARLYVRYWPLADLGFREAQVCFLTQSGHSVLQRT